MLRPVVLILCIVASAAGLTACAEKATDAEIDAMCERLLVLRSKPDDPEMKSTCVSDAKAEGTSKRQARCRISAVNTQEYWNRCRTGSAR